MAVGGTPSVSVLRGRDGRDGPRGRDGRDGVQGPVGPRGSPGMNGPPGTSRSPWTKEWGCGLHQVGEAYLQRWSQSSLCWSNGWEPLPYQAGGGPHDCACPMIPTTPSHSLVVCRATAHSTMSSIRTPCSKPWPRHSLCCVCGAH